MTIVAPAAHTVLAQSVTAQPPRDNYKRDWGRSYGALRRLLNDPPLRARMGAAGRARVVERFDYRLVARQLAGILTRHLGVE